MSGGLDQRYAELEELERDGSTVVCRAIDAIDGSPVLLRRIVPSRRGDGAAREGLAIEAEYSARLACPRCPSAELITAGDGEVALRYAHAGGVELDRVLDVLEASGRILEPHAAIVLISEVIHAADAIQQIPPPVGAPKRWGHGEITPRSVLLGVDGFARLFELRLASAGFRAIAEPAAPVCRAPELSGGVLVGSAEGDVYAIAALLSLTLFGPSALLARANLGPVADSVRLLAAEAKPPLPEALIEVLLRGLARAPEDRPATPALLRDELRASVSFDYERWRETLTGLAAMAEELAQDRDATVLSPALLLDHAALFRPLERPVPQGDGLGPRRSPLARPAAVLPRRIAVVPRRVPVRAPSWIAPPPGAPRREPEPAAPPSPDDTRFDPEAAEELLVRVSAATAAADPLKRLTPLEGTPAVTPPPVFAPRPMIAPHVAGGWLMLLSILAIVGLLVAGTIALERAQHGASPAPQASER